LAEQEYSESGDPILRYDHIEPKPFTPATGDGETVMAVSNHIEKHIGKIEAVFHEIVSDLVHLDVYWVAPSEQFPFHSLVTSGMSDLPMKVPEGSEQSRYAELCILLPNDWKIAAMPYSAMEEVFKDENNYWPVRWLKIIARFPHEYDTWVASGHTIPNGPDAAPFAANTKLGCMILLPSLSIRNGFSRLKVNKTKQINFYCLYPLYKEEMDYKLKKGLDALIDRFEKHHVTDVVDINRRNVCLKSGPFGLW
jgi:Suppressor of fused protein (SUFU)